MTKTTLWTTLLVLFLGLFESTVLANISFFPFIPDLVLIVVLYISFFNGSLYGEVNGFISGLIIDFLSAAPLGLNAFIRTVHGFVYGLFKGTVNIDKFFFPFLLGFTSTILKAFTTWLLSLFYSGLVVNYNLFSYQFWIECGINGLFTPLVFLLLRFFPNFISEKQDLDNV